MASLYHFYIDQPFVLLDLSISDLSAALEAGKITSKELIEQYIARIEAYDDQGPKLNAILIVNPDAIAQAEQLDQERKEKGSRGPLHGIPIILKDNYNTKDMPTTASSKAFEGFMPAEDATTVAKLKEAGAIIIAKSNLHEMAMSGTTMSSLGGQTLNPYDLTRTPGGSSGGTGAALAANFAVAGTGTDTVNSVRSPSSANNLVGIRPTKGLISLDGIFPVSATQDAPGPIARTVEDAAIVLDAMAGFDPKDPSTEVAQGKVPATYTEALDISGLEGARIGVLDNLFGKDPIHEEVNKVTMAAVEDMEKLGATMVDIEVPGLDTDQLIKDMDVQRYEIREGLNAYFSKYNTPVKTLEEMVAGGQFDASIANTLKQAQAVEKPLEQEDYHLRLAKMAELKQTILTLMDEHQLDAIFYPHQKRLVVKVGEGQADRNGILGSLTGLPAITFQGGFSTPDATAPGGVPVGIELLGRPFSESTIIKLAYSYEQGTNHRKLPSSTPALAGKE